MNLPAKKSIMRWSSLAAFFSWEDPPPPAMSTWLSLTMESPRERPLRRSAIDYRDSPAHFLALVFFLRVREHLAQNQSSSGMYSSGGLRQ